MGIPEGVVGRWAERQHEKGGERKKSRIDMALVVAVGLKLHKKSDVRRRIAMRLKTAIGLIVTRGADTMIVEDKPTRLVFREDGGGRGLILDDWVYVIYPSLGFYRGSYGSIVGVLRSGLSRIYLKGDKMEREWRGRCT